MLNVGGPVLLFVIYFIPYSKFIQTTKNNFMAKLHNIQIHYLSSKSAAAIVLSNRQGLAHVELDDSCVKSELDHEIFSSISLFIGVT